MKKVLLAVLCSAAICSCGSVSNGLAFKPPADWVSTPSFFGHFQMWMKKGSTNHHGSVVMLIRGGLDMKDFNSAPSSAISANDLRDLKRDTITICGNQKAQHMSAIGNNNVTNGPSAIEGVIARVGDSKYLALYVRPGNQPPDAAAEESIRSICAA